MVAQWKAPMHGPVETRRGDEAWPSWGRQWGGKAVARNLGRPKEEMSSPYISIGENGPRWGTPYGATTCMRTDSSSLYDPQVSLITVSSDLASAVRSVRA